MATIILEGRCKSTMHVGDCLDYLPGIPDGAIDVCVTSPPVDLGTSHGSRRGGLSRGDYLDWMAEVSSQLLRVLSDQGSLFLNVSFSSKDPYVDLEVANLLRADWVLQNKICWAKAVEVKGMGYGHFGSARSRFHVDVTSEQIMHLTKDGHVPIDRMAIGVPYMDKSNIARFNRPADRRCRGNIWYIPYPPVTDQANRGKRPATFPVELPRMCIKLHGLERVRTVLDPFAGTGATLAAALELGVTGIGIDIDPDYSVMALERLMDMCEVERGMA